MARTLADHLRESERARSPRVAAARDVFGRHYAIARQVIEMREKRGLTQDQLARCTGLQQSQISRIERGAVSPNIATLTRIGEALEFEVRLVERPRKTARRRVPSAAGKRAAAR